MADKSDLIIKLYELNEKYHDQKDSRAWVATTLFLTYSIALFAWLIDHNDFSNLYSLAALIVHFIISLSTFLYVSFQFQMKTFSLNYESTLQAEINDSIKTDISKLKHRKNITTISFDRFPIYFILILFTLINVLMLIRSLSNEPKINLTQLDIFLLIIIIISVISLAVLISFILARKLTRVKKN